MLIDIQASSYRENPYPTFEYLRSRKTLYRAKSFGSLLVANYTDVKKILKQPDIFCSSGILKSSSLGGPHFLLETRGLIDYDKPYHTQVRRHFNKCFTLSSIREYESVIRLTCQTLIRNMIQREYVNIIDDFAKPLPLLVLAAMIDMPIERYGEFEQWSEILLTWRSEGKTAKVLSMAKQMFDRFIMLINNKMDNPKNDLISKFIIACDKKIENHEILAMLRLLLLAGIEPVTNLIGNGVLQLCKQPDLQSQLQAQPALIKNFIEELLRHNSPVLCLSRRVNVNTHIGTTKIKGGEIVLALLGSANHDEAIFASPELFDIHRDYRAHLSFGTGIHYCMGVHLARLQAQIAFEELLKVFKKFKIQAGTKPAYLDAFFFRGIRNLWLELGL